MATARQGRDPDQPISKWDALRALATARRVYGLSDRDLSVLQALLSFHPATDLEPGGNLVVHPSNRAICERLNGMANSTMRRHLARLVGAGVLTRRDSPNGKRYARRQGREKTAFGFDLRPLLNRFTEFRATAADVQAEEIELRRLRETVSLMRRDLAALTVWGQQMHPKLGLWERLSNLATLAARDLRRKLDRDALRKLEAYLQAALDEAEAQLLTDDAAKTCTETSESSTSAAGNEHNIQRSEKESFEERDGQGGTVTHRPQPPSEISEPELPRKKQKGPNVPLQLVLNACKEIQCYVAEPLRHWHDLVRAAEIVSPMMGISRSAWERAMTVMGPEGAAVTVAAILERMAHIRSPGGYLRCLTSKASEGRFSCGPMIAALSLRGSGDGATA